METASPAKKQKSQPTAKSQISNPAGIGQLARMQQKGTRMKLTSRLTNSLNPLRLLLESHVMKVEKRTNPSLQRTGETVHQQPALWPTATAILMMNHWSGSAKPESVGKPAGVMQKAGCNQGRDQGLMVPGWDWLQEVSRSCCKLKSKQRLELAA